MTAVVVVFAIVSTSSHPPNSAFKWTRWLNILCTSSFHYFGGDNQNGVEMIYQGQARDGLSSSGALKAVGAGWLLCALADVSLIIISPHTSSGTRLIMSANLNRLNTARLDSLPDIRGRYFLLPPSQPYRSRRPYPLLGSSVWPYRWGVQHVSRC